MKGKKEKKRQHTRPVMQKHTFNVRLGSAVMSRGERKKLGWNDRKGGMQNCTSPWDLC